MTFLAGDGVVPGQRGARLRDAPDRAARGPLRAPARHRPTLPGRAGWAGHRPHGRPAIQELAAQRETIIGILELEERRFLETLATGESRLATWIAEARGRNERMISGEKLFVLQSTYGFPYELSEEIIAEEGLSVDRAGFERSRGASTARSVAASASPRSRPAASTPPCPRPASSATTTSPVRPSCCWPRRPSGSRAARRSPGRPPGRSELAEGRHGVLILDRTPFYAEGGGQVGDRGLIRLPRALRGARTPRTTATATSSTAGRSSRRGPSRPGGRGRVDAHRRAETTAPPQPDASAPPVTARRARPGHPPARLAGRARCRPLRLQRAPAAEWRAAP